MRLMTKIVAGFSLILILVFSLIITTHVLNNKIVEDHKAILEVEVPLEIMAEKVIGYEGMLSGNAHAALLHAIDGEANLVRRHKRMHDNISVKLDNILKVEAFELLSRSQRPENDKEKARGFIAEFDEANMRLVELETEAFRLMEKNQTEKAYSLIVGGEYHKHKENLKNIYSEWAAEESRITHMLEKEIEKNNGVILQINLLITILAIMLTVIMMVYITVIMIMPLKRLREVASKIGKGDFDARCEVDSTDEIGRLAQTINMMAEDLQQLKNKIIESEKSVQKELKKEVKKKTSEAKEKLKESEKMKKATFNMMEDMNMVNEKLKKANDDLKEMDKVKTNFLNIVSHELKTPLTATFAHIGVLEDYSEKFDDEQNSSLMAIKRNSRSLKTLINNILEISRIEAGKFELTLSEMNMKKLVDDIIGELKVLSEKKNIEMKAESSEELPSIAADEMRVKEVLTNLIGNAIKFTDKGSVTVRLSKDEKDMKVEVIDTGSGIPEDKMKGLFNKFYQVDSTISRRHGGTGLGLSISKQLIEMQNGKIGVKSKEGEGSNFFFTLPLERGSKDKGDKDEKDTVRGGQ